MVRGEHNAYIPTDLIPEILSRLSRKSVARFRCVSKLWRSILSGPRLLFALERSNHEFLFFSSHSPYEKSPLVVTADFHMRFSQDLYPNFGGFTSGLIYFSHLQISKNECWQRQIYNLNTGRNMTLPRLDRYRKCNSFLGFDPLDKQFKVLFMAYLGGPDDDRILTVTTGKKKWRKIECPIRPEPSCDHWTCINGVLYYIGKNGGDSYLICCFDVRSETFEFVEADCFRNPQVTQLINYKGKLCGIDLTYNDSNAIVLHMWILEDVETEEWSEYVYTFPENDIYEKIVVVGMTTTGEIILSEKYTSKQFCVFYFSPERNTLRRVEIRGVGMKLLRMTPEFMHL
ncbi:unnamed protein product [Eruca vesicaria subsp. sativa]|uniref:F-box domain-containing protein n=1 Tax=Eruca vesicaria subsp. sativa TaxID=29727 RepID=A0ABC8KJX7_ERUVS|nr:unnamed protein product [Eruca vesicaria subsp. sativa]